MTEKEILGLITVIIGFVGYVPYFVGIFKGQIKPHVFTWIIWTLLTGIATAAQWVDGAGPGMWVTAITAIVSLVITVLAFKVGKKEDISKSDWVAFISCLVTIPIWYLTNNPLWAVIIITIIDAVSFYPTFRKGYVKPWSEGAITFFLSGIKFAIALFALENVTLVTALYPASLVLMNCVFAALLVIRRRVIPKESVS